MITTLLIQQNSIKNNFMCLSSLFMWHICVTLNYNLWSTILCYLYYREITCWKSHHKGFLKSPKRGTYLTSHIVSVLLSHIYKFTHSVWLMFDLPYQQYFLCRLQIWLIVLCLHFLLRLQGQQSFRQDAVIVSHSHFSTYHLNNY